MEPFHWDTHFETGLATVDQQHHHLVNLVNQFGKLITRTEAISVVEMDKIFGELSSYTQYHFLEEEQMTLQVGIDNRHYIAHKELHDEFIQKVVSMHEAMLACPENAQNLFKLLTSWLAFHILGIDQSMARQVMAIKSGVSPEDAYLQDRNVKGTTTEPLLATLNTLFLQVSERNHELQELNSTLEKKVSERTQALLEANILLEKIAMTDVLTGLPNRRQAMESLVQEWDKSRMNNKPLAVMMIDADGFKQINDNYGHDAGDEVLKQLANRLRESVRNDDIVCRLGGDEFFIIATNTDLAGAMIVAHKIREQVASLRVKVQGGEWVGSISVGVATRTSEMIDIEELMKAADKGVYIAKQNGRNRVESNL